MTLDIAQQAMREVLVLAPGHRLVVERHIDDRAPFTITVERNPGEKRAYEPLPPNPDA